MFLFCSSFNGLLFQLFSHHYVQFLLFIQRFYNIHYFSHHYVQFLLFIHWLYTMHFTRHHYIQFLFLLSWVFNHAVFSVTIMFNYCFCFHWFLTMHFFSHHYVIFVIEFSGFLPCIFSAHIMFGSFNLDLKHTSKVQKNCSKFLDTCTIQLNTMVTEKNAWLKTNESKNRNWT